MIRIKTSHFALRTSNFAANFAACFCGLLVLILANLQPVVAQKFYPDDPVQEDMDRLPIPMPEDRAISQITDFLENTFIRRPEPGEEIPRAENINTVGEVPDSSWFTRRLGTRPLSLDELKRGPDRSDGPDPSAPWTIISAKTEGITPGFTIRDGRGDVYFIKFDPAGYPQLATSSEVMVTKFFHALGYNVPENYLAVIDPARLEIDATAEITGDHGLKRSMTRGDIEEILERVPIRSDGRVQAVASRRLAGRSIGHFKYFGTRPDDPNDIFPHRNRRELRALRVFSAWLNHDDSRSINSLDMYVGNSPEGWVLHYLLDFGSCLGSGSVRPQSRRAGYEYLLEWDPIFKSMLSLGLWDRKWRSVDYPDDPSIGRFEADFFEPWKWKPEYPNPAFDRMLTDDAFWAARLLMKFTDEMIRAVVETGRLENAAAEEYLIQTVIRRRDKIVRYYFSVTNPISEFEIRSAPDSPRLAFENLGESAGLAAQTNYRVEWFVFDNRQSTLQPIDQPRTLTAREIPIPDGQSAYLMARIHAISVEQPAWNEPVDVYLRQETGWKIVGIERPAWPFKEGEKNILKK